LVVQYAEAEQWDEAEDAYNEFQKDYSGSDYRYEVLAAALPVLAARDRVDDGIARLREVIWDHRDDPQSVTLAQMFGSFAEYLEEHVEDERFNSEMVSLQSDRGTTPSLLGWTTIAMADFLEKKEVKREEVDKLFYRFEAGLKPAQHSNFPLVRLARWISHSRKKPEEAKGIYDFILKERPGTANYEYCLVDVAEIEANSEEKELRESAMNKFQRVLAEFPNEELQEKAVLGMARIRTAEKSYAEAVTHWESYLENRGWNLARPEANYQLAYCLEQQGDLASALKIYVSVYANFAGYLDWSTRAYLRTAAILKGQGQDLNALKVLQDMLKRMGHHKHPGVAKGKELFTKWRSEYTPPETGGKG
ncbi:MAG: tetratricopeptide repeat protein, partial [Verrucomicrobiota bacterium]